jgi:hypothetical protein
MTPPRPLAVSAPADPAGARAAELLRRLQPPPRFSAAASARLDETIAAAFKARMRRRRWGVLLATAALAGLAAVALPRRTRDDLGFHARGRAAPAVASGAPELQIFRIGREGAQPLRGVLARDEELAFAYRSEGTARRLLVFARDEHAHVYWYHPAWTDPAADPEAVTLSPAPGLHELPAAIAHALDGRRLELCWLFTVEPLRAREVEAALARGALAPACQTVEVTP